MTLRRLLLITLLAASPGPLARAADMPRVDRYGEPLPEGAIARLGSGRLRPDGPGQGITFAPDGKTLVSVSTGRTAQVWDPATGREVHRVSLPPPGGWRVAFGADARTLIVGGGDGAIHFLDLASGAKQRTLTAPENASNLAGLCLSGDGKTLVASYSPGVVVVWDVPGGRVRHRLGGAGSPFLPSLIAITPDGKHFVMARQDHSLHLMDCATGKDVRAFDMGPAGPARNFQTRVQRLALSPDGKLLAYGGWDRDVSVCSVETGKVVTHFGMQNPAVGALAFSPNGRFLAVGTYPGVRVFGLASGKELRLLETQPGTTSTALAWAPDGKGLAGVSQDGSLRLWDVLDGRELHPPVGHPSNVQQLVFLGDSRRLVSYGGDGRLLLWDATTGQELDQLRGVPFNPQAMTRTPDGQGVQAPGYDQALRVWRPGAAVEMVRRDLPRGVVFQSAVSPDGRWAAEVRPGDRKLRVHNLTSEHKEARELPLPEQVWTNTLTFAPDGRRLATSSTDGLVRVWDCATGRLVRALGGAEGGGPRFTSRMAFSADGRSLLAFDGALRIYEVASGLERCQLAGGAGGVQSVAWSPDGRLVALSTPEGVVALCAAATGKDLARLDGRQGQVNPLAFSPDSRLLASGGINGTTLVWAMPAPAAPLASLPADRLRTLWIDLADAEPGRAYRAVAALAEAPGPAVGLLKERLKALVERPDPRRLEKLIEDLESDTFAVRETANRELAEAGEAAGPALRKAVEKSPSVEVRRRVQDLLDRLAKEGLAPERLRAVRAVEVLERVGTPAARQVLADVARVTADPALADETRASLERLDGRR
jgi:WD40 repeat protein